MATTYKSTGKTVRLNGKKKKVYIKVGTAKRYVNYKNKKIRLGKWKKIMKAKQAKKSTRRTKKH